MSTLSHGGVQAVHELDHLPWLQAKQLITFAEWQMHSGKDLAGAGIGLQRAITQLLQLEQYAGAGMLLSTAAKCLWQECMHWPQQPWGAARMLEGAAARKGMQQSMPCETLHELLAVLRAVDLPAGSRPSSQTPTSSHHPGLPGNSDRSASRAESKNTGVSSGTRQELARPPQLQVGLHVTRCNC